MRYRQLPPINILDHVNTCEVSFICFHDGLSLRALNKMTFRTNSVRSRI